MVWVEGVRREYGLASALAAVGLARSTWYYHRTEKVSYEAKYGHLRALLEEIARKHPEYGCGGSNLKGANLRAADLGGANLWGADLEGAHLEGARLWRAQFNEARVRAARLKGADLEGANLGLADLGGTDLGGANLKMAHLSPAHSLTRGQILSARDWRGAELPRGLKGLEIPLDAPEEELDRLGRTWKPEEGSPETGQ